MKKSKIAWLVIAVASVAIIIIAAFYLFSGKETPQAEHYWWQQDAEIVKVSERFKRMDPYDTNRTMEAKLLLPIIKEGSSSREVEALFGKPFTRPSSRQPGILEWQYFIFYGNTHAISFRISGEGKVINKGGA